MVQICKDCPKEHKTRWEAEHTRECSFSYDPDNANDCRIVSLISKLIRDNQPTCQNCGHHYFENSMGYRAIQCEIHGNIEYINHPHYDMDGSKCGDYKRE